MLAPLGSLWAFSAEITRLRPIAAKDSSMNCACRLPESTLTSLDFGYKGTASSGSSLFGKPQDTTSTATRGGIYVRQNSQDPPDFDPLAGALSTGGRTIWVYSRLLKHKVGK